jgi:hypothetical protein
LKQGRRRRRAGYSRSVLASVVPVDAVVWPLKRRGHGRRGYPTSRSNSELPMTTAKQPRPLSTLESFLIGGVAACCAVSDHCVDDEEIRFSIPARSRSRTRPRWQRRASNYRANLPEVVVQGFTTMFLMSLQRHGGMKAFVGFSEGFLLRCA